MRERRTDGRKGIPLRDLRDNEERLRAEEESREEAREEARERTGNRDHTGATPIPIERENTSRLAGEFAQHAGAGAAQPMDFEGFIDRLADKLVEKGGRGSGDDGGSGKKTHPEANAWIRWSLGAIVIVLSAWWLLGEKLAERPTTDQIKELRAPELEAVKRHEFEIRDQRDSIIRMTGTLEQVSIGISEIKAELKSR